MIVMVTALLYAIIGATSLTSSLLAFLWFMVVALLEVECHPEHKRNPLVNRHYFSSVSREEVST